jgi:glycosyl transferase family 25
VEFRQLPAFCVNLDARADRWALAEAEFARIGWPVTRWSAVCRDQSPYPKLSAAQAGCRDSHATLWRHCLAENLEMLAVFEDDVVFPADFKDIFPLVASELPADWELWHLHSSKARVTRVSAHLVRIIGNMWGSHGYVVSRRGCEKLLALSDQNAQPVDCYMSGAFNAAGGRVYGVPPAQALVFQRGDDTDIPGTAQLAFWRQQRARFCR